MTTTLPDTIEHLDFTYEPPCEEEECDAGHPRADAAVMFDCPCGPPDVILCCRSCTEDYVEGGVHCAGCGADYAPGERLWVRWLR